MNKDAARTALLAANRALGSIEPPLAYWLDCGSLLGAVRDGDIMDHDLDVDFSCKDWERHDEVEEAMRSAGFQMFRTFGTPEHGFEQRFKAPGVKVDVFYFYEGTAQGPELGTCWQGSWDGARLIESRFPSDIVADTVPLEFQGDTVPVPIEYEALLAARYGDWTVPVRKWDWRRDPKCIVEDTPRSIEDVTFLLKSFMRPEITLRAIHSIQATYPGAGVLVVDDSDISADFENEVKALGGRMIRLPYDSGLSAGRNAGLREISTRFVVIMDDDMVVAEATRVPEMLELLENADIVCGSMKQSGSIIHWEGTYDLTNDGGLRLLQRKGLYQKTDNGIRWAPVEFGLNCFVSRTEFLRAHPWDEDLKLHEHTDFFLRLRGTAKVIFTPDAIFDHRPERKPDYLRMRRRREFRLLFFSKHKLRYHIGVSGKLDEWTRRDDVALARLKKTGPERGPLMGLDIQKPGVKADSKGVELDRRTFLDARGKVTYNVRQGVKLFGLPGQRVSLEEARSIGLVIPAESSKPEPTTSPKSGLTQRGDLRRANLATLQEAARESGLDDSGTKRAILERIKEHDEKSGAGQ